MNTIRTLLKEMIKLTQSENLLPQSVRGNAGPTDCYSSETDLNCLIWIDRLKNEQIRSMPLA